MHVARQAELLVRGLARVGIIARVDEATGYQEVRAKTALVEILEAFIATELQPWVSTFPDDFYAELFRLRGLEYPRATVRRPQYFGHLTNDIVYKRLAPGVLAELKNVTPRDDHGRRKHKYFQRLTTNVGYPKLREHLGSVVTIMKLSANWQDFMGKLDRFTRELATPCSSPSGTKPRTPGRDFRRWDRPPSEPSLPCAPTLCALPASCSLLVPWPLWRCPQSTSHAHTDRVGARVTGQAWHDDSRPLSDAPATAEAPKSAEQGSRQVRQESLGRWLAMCSAEEQLHPVLPARRRAARRCQEYAQ
jgi:hypothetical protein